MNENLFGNMTPEEIAEFLINLNKYRLNFNSYIKKYNKVRKLHYEVLNKMLDYAYEKHFEIFEENQNKVCEEIRRYKKNFKFVLSSEDIDDMSVLAELDAYKNHPDIPCLCDIFTEKNKFRNEDKKKMLQAMRDSYASLFKIVAVDRDNGYVTYEDVFTNKRFKIIDIAMSSTLTVNKNHPVYIYNRIITFDDISFGTGIHCSFFTDNKLLKEFIKEYNKNKCSDYARCLILYDISKNDNRMKSVCNY